MSRCRGRGLRCHVSVGPGDRVLVPRPSYPLFEHLTQLESVTAIPYSLEYHGAWRIDVESSTVKIVRIVIPLPSSQRPAAAACAEVRSA